MTDTNLDELTRRHLFKLSAMAGMTGLLTTGTQTAIASSEEDEKEREGEEYNPGFTIQSVDEDELVQAIATDEFWGSVDEASFEGVDVQVESFEQEIQGFPEHGDAFTVLSSGIASDAPGDPEEFASTNVNGRDIPNYSPDDFDAFNVAELKIDFTVPENAEGVAFDYRFGTDESPSFLGSQFQDFFEAALILPDGSATNIAQLPDDTPVTVDNADNFANTPGGSSQNPQSPLPDPPDTVYNAVTDLQTAERGIAGFEGEQLRLVLRIADASDGVYDSAAFVDNLQFVGEVENPLEPVEEAFDQWRSTLKSVTEGVHWREARTLAILYEEHGEEFSEPLVDMFAYQAGELDEGEINEDFRTVVEDVSEPISESDAKEHHDLYNEMFSAASPADDFLETTSTFYEYLMGIHDSQNNFLLSEGRTTAELVEHRQSQSEDYESQFISDMQDSDFTGKEIQQITSVIQDRIDYLTELLIKTEREASATATSLTGDEDFEGQLYTTEFEEENETDAIGAQAIITGSALIAAGVLTAKGISVKTLAIKGGSAAASGIKSTSTGKSAISIAQKHGIGNAAQITWLQNKAGAATTWFHSNIPYSHTLVTAVEFGENYIHAKKILEYASSAAEYSLAWPMAAKLETKLSTLDTDAELETEYTSPDRCLFLAKRDADLTNIFANDIGLTDHFEGLWPPYGRQTGWVTVQNTGDVPFTPLLEATIYEQDVAPSGQARETTYPILFTEPIPELDPGEVQTIEYEYVVPVGLFNSSYEVRIESEYSDDKLTAEFEAGTAPSLSSVKNIASGTLSDGESQVHHYGVGTKTATVELEYTGFNADLHLYDIAGNHVGQNYETNEFENEIPGAVHSGHDQGALGNESVTVDDPDPEYDVEVVVPEVETLTQNGTDAVSIQAGGGDVEYDISAIEVPEINGSLNLTINDAAKVKQPGETADIEFGIRETSQQDSVADVTLSGTALISENDEISPENIEFSDQGVNVAPGSVEQFTASIDVPEDASRETYSGEITAAGDGSEATITREIILSIEDLSVEDYVDEEGIIKLAGLRDAISDWRGGDIDDELLGAVTESWRTQEQIE